jgi:hypothetical protein
MADTPQPRTGFDWAIYSDATLAGLAILIPLPIVDSMFEQFFRRRIPATIARRHGRVLDAAVIAALNKDERSCLAACLTFPITATVWLIKRIFRKILYFLTVKEATDQISQYWQRAFLIDYMIPLGHLDNTASAAIARQALDRVLQARSSPLTQFARQIIPGTRSIWRSLRRARQGNEDVVIQQTRAEMNQSWGNFDAYFRTLARQYEQAYQEILHPPSR